MSPLKTNPRQAGDSADGPAKGEALACEESRVEGKVDLAVYMYYISSIGKCLSASILFTLLGMQLSANAFSYWLSLWSADPNCFTAHRFLEISGIIAGINTLFVLARAFLFAFGGLKAARLLHDKLLSAVLSTHLSFFESNPVGKSSGYAPNSNQSHQRITHPLLRIQDGS